MVFNMWTLKMVVAGLLLIVLLCCVTAVPQPSVIREKYIIHAPIKFKTIHHHKIQKVPIVVKKHIYYHKNKEEIKPVVEEDYDNQIHNDYTEHTSKYNDFNLDYTYGKYNDQNIYHGYQGEIPFHEEDYEHPKQSEEEDYEDYEYE